MDKKIIQGVLLLLVFSIGLLLLLPRDDSRNTPETLPWHIAHPTPETSKVFGVTLGESTVGQVEKYFNDESEISLFKAGNGKMTVESYFDEVNFNGLKAKVVLNVTIPEDILTGMFNRGLRMNGTPSGTGKRITLTPDDLEVVRKSPVATLTYMPTVRIEDAILKKRFGEPAERIKEKESGNEHWLYPQQGLDITLGGQEKPVLQYISPKDFDLLRTPLLAQGELLK
jgi:hypothetical protein